jgi:hypothetical protein
MQIKDVIKNLNKIEDNIKRVKKVLNDNEVFQRITFDNPENKYSKARVHKYDEDNFFDVFLNGVVGIYNKAIDKREEILELEFLLKEEIDGSNQFDLTGAINNFEREYDESLDDRGRFIFSIGFNKGVRHTSSIDLNFTNHIDGLKFIDEVMED